MTRRQRPGPRRSLIPPGWSSLRPWAWSPGRPRRASRLWRELALPVLVIAALSLLVTGNAAAPFARARGPRPSVLGGAAWVAPSYFDRSRVAAQTVEPPGLVREILLPTLGSPARVGASTRVPVVLGVAPGRWWTFELIPRAALAAIDRDLYAVSPMPRARETVADRLRESREARQVGDAPARPRVLSESQRALAEEVERHADYGAQIDAVTTAVAAEDGPAVRRRVATVRRHLAALITGPARSARRRMTWSGRGARVGSARAWRVDAEVPSDLANGLYALAVFDGEGRLVDVQLNAVYRADEGVDFDFIVAADLQWGELRAVASSTLRFVSTVNGLAAGGGRSPEFVVIAGDIVDCHFGSSGTASSKVFVGGTDYPRDFLQAWLALAALRVPAYVIPGNHDGFRFEGFLSSTTSDGLLLFEDTFGPPYFRFDRGAWRFILLNSYDLPADFRTSRRSTSSSVFEDVSNKLNVLNWGGGVQTPQLAWLREQLGLANTTAGAATPSPDTLPLLFMHHDPRGTYPAFRRPSPTTAATWTTARHYPVTADADERDDVAIALPPHFADTEEIHAGYYTPLRRPDSEIRSGAWFELGLNPVPPDVRGYPGWLRWQQGWHSDFVYAGSIANTAPFTVAEGVASPADVLRAVVDGRVRAIFNGHDNRFCHAELAAGESVFGAAAERDLRRVASERGRALLEQTRLRRELSAWHVADIADADTDGHGYLWVEARGRSLDAFEIDHF